MNARKAFFEVLENQVYNFILNASYAGDLDQNWYARAYHMVKDTCWAMNFEVSDTQIEILIDDAYDAYNRTFAK